jgi:hypothetical protein
MVEPSIAAVFGMTSIKAVQALMVQSEQAVRQSLGVHDVLLGLPSSHVCAYCGTKQSAERCESCGAPQR